MVRVNLPDFVIINFNNISCFIWSLKKVNVNKIISLEDNPNMMPRSLLLRENGSEITLSLMSSKVVCIKLNL